MASNEQKTFQGKIIRSEEPPNLETPFEQLDGLRFADKTNALGALVQKPRNLQSSNPFFACARLIASVLQVSDRQTSRSQLQSPSINTNKVKCCASLPWSLGDYAPC